MKRLWSFNRQMVFGHWVSSDHPKQDWYLVPFENEFELEGKIEARRAMGIPVAIEYTGQDRLDRQMRTFSGWKDIQIRKAGYLGSYSSLVYDVRAVDPTASIEEDRKRFAVVICCQPWLEIPVRYAAWKNLSPGVLLEVNPKPVPPARPFMKPAQNRMQRFWAWLSNGLSNDGGLPL